MAAQTNKWIVAITVLIPTLMVVVDGSVVNVALDHIRGSLSAGIDEATWSVTSYLAANAVFIPMAGWLSRVFGRRRYLHLLRHPVHRSSLLSAGSPGTSRVCGLPGPPGHRRRRPAARVSIDSAGDFPPPRHRHSQRRLRHRHHVRACGLNGPLLGGWITDNWSWHWIFFINVPIGIISVLMTMLFITDPSSRKATKMKIDYWGLLLLATGIGCLQMVLDQGQREDWFSSGFIIWTSVTSVQPSFFLSLPNRTLNSPSLT